MTEETLGAGWAAAAQSVEQEMATWRRAQPRATLTEIELAVEAATARLHAHLIAELVHGVGEAAAAEQPAVCPGCGGRLKRRGRRVREVVTARQPQPLRLEREYFVCSACGAGYPRAGVFPLR